MSEELKPCPMCGGGAAFKEDGEGGHYIECQNKLCAITTNLRYACGEDPKPLLAEVWNRRAQPEPAAPAGEFCWLVEMFKGDGSGNSAGLYHTGLVDIGGYSRTTRDVYQARRYSTREHAKRVATELGTTLTGIWRAVEHGFASAQVAAPSVAPEPGGWLIEHSGKIPGSDCVGTVSWLYVTPKYNGYGASKFGFTHDSNQALRFARKEDAEAVLKMHLGAQPPKWYSEPYSVTEHMWPAAHPPRAPLTEPAAPAAKYSDLVSDGGMDPRNAAPAEPAPGWCKHCRQYTIAEPLGAAPSVAPEPLFLLHSGQIDSGGEQDDWETEADSQVRVDEFCRLHPGKTIPLFAHPPRAPLTRREIESVMTEHYPLDCLLRENVDAFEACVRDLEAAHGISAEGERP